MFPMQKDAATFLSAEEDVSTGDQKGALDFINQYGSEKTEEQTSSKEREQN